MCLRSNTKLYQPPPKKTQTTAIWGNIKMISRSLALSQDKVIKLRKRLSNTEVQQKQSGIRAVTGDTGPLTLCVVLLILNSLN